MTTEIKNLLGQSKTLFEQAEEILSNPELTPEDEEKVEKMLADAKGFQAKAAKLDEIMKAKMDIVDKTSKVVEPKSKDGDDVPDTKDVKSNVQAKTGFKTWEDFVVAAWLANHRKPSVAKFDPRLVAFNDPAEQASLSNIEGKAGMSGLTGATGGFLIPAEFYANLMGVVGESSIVRSRATIIRMRRRQIGIPVLDQTGTTAGRPHWFGGMRFYWEEESAAKTVTEAEFRKVNLVARKLIGYTYASDELIADSAISLSDFLSGPLGFAGGVSWMEDYAFIQGTGVGQPLGVINAGATISVARAATSPPVGYTDLANMMESFLPSGRGVWFISQSLMSDLLTMSGPTGNASYLWGSAVTGVPNVLLGYPVVWTEKTPLAGTAGDIILADWRYYLLGDRQASTIESTQYDRWQYDETSWRVVHRVDGQPWLSAPLTYQDGTTQVSPFVILGDKTT